MSGTVVTMFLDRTSSHADEVAFRRRAGEEWETISWGDYRDAVRKVFGALRALGLDAEDKAAILSNNRFEWHVADIATQCLGGVTVPIYQTNSPPQVRYITQHSESKVIFCEDAAQVAKVLEVRHELPALRKIVVFNTEGVPSNDDIVGFDAFAASGEAYNADNPADFDAKTAAVRPEQLATLVYTSGTTGEPKGAMLSHANIVWTCGSLAEVLPSGPGDRRLSYLPLSHIAERMVSDFTHIHDGFETWFARGVQPPEHFREDLGACKPTVFFGVPRIWEKFHDGINALLGSLDPETAEKARQAIQLGLKRVEAQQAGTSLPDDLEAKYQEADGQLFALARGALGLDQAKALVSGAAPINPEVLRFFHAIGLPVIEVYGQTEDCGPSTINRVEHFKIGTVGPAVPGVEIRIADDGEILVKGGNVGLGYYKNPEATAELIDADGWMHTGDIGVLDADGFLTITDRKKDLIITAGGKNIAPQVIENKLKHQAWISQCVVIGDRRPYLVALLTLDEEKVTAFAEQKSIAHESFPELAEHPDVKQLVDNAVAEVNSTLAKVEQVKKWHVFDREFQQDEGEVTPTLKIRRKAIIDKNEDLIERLYS
jgi:long-chain acyl-CoA synthetase